MKYKKYLFIMSRYGFFIILLCLLTAVIVLLAQNNIAQQRRTDELKEAMLEHIAELDAAIEKRFALQTELLLETGQIIAAAVIEEIGDGAAATGNRINLTNERIQQINAVYAGLLAEMEMRTLDSLYMESVLADKEREAAVLFRGGKFAQASALYLTVSEAQPENFEARFYYFYSLFLNNRMDRSNYPRIKEGMQALERNGYLRTQIREVLEYIELEERGLGTGARH